MLFSILVANYNNGKYFKDCYQSIIAQTYTNWEVIIVDDGSTDDSIKIIETIIKNDSRFKLFKNNKNRGCGYTKNKCVELASGEICCFLDPDDAIYDKALEIMRKTHLENPSIALAYSDWELLDASLEQRVQPIIERTQIKNKEQKFINIKGEVGALAVFKKSFYLKTSGISPWLKRAVDQDLYLKLYETGDFLYIPELLYKYRIHNRGISTLANRKKARYWHWMVIMDTSKRRNLNFENEFAESFLLPDECWMLKKEVSENPLLILKKIFQTLLNKVTR